MFCKPGDTVRFSAFFQAAATGLGKIGLTPTISVNEGVTNKVSVASASFMTQADETNQPGLYYYDYTVTATFYGSITAQAKTSNATCLTQAINMQYFSVAWLDLIQKLDVGEPSEPVIAIPGSPQDATTARVYGYFKTLENISATAIPVKFTLLPKEAVKATTIIVPEVVSASIKNGQLTDENGNLYITLILNESITPTGTYYQVDIPKASISKTFYLNSSTITSGLFDLATVITG